MVEHGRTMIDRNAYMREYNRRRYEAETPIEREERLAYGRLMYRIRRQAETAEQREARLIKQREYNSKRKAIHDH